MLKRYTQFIKENLNQKQNYYVDLIIDYLRKNSNYNLFPYEEEFDVIKSTGTYTGKLYLTGKSKAIRFNFNDNLLHSVDMWLNFEFTNDNKIHIKPDYTMYIKGSVVGMMDDFVAFIDGEFDIKEYKEEEFEESDKEIEKSPEEDVKLKTLTISSKVIEHDMDIFDAINSYTLQVAHGISNSLIISGGAGLGKTSEVTNSLKDTHVKYEKFTGDITTAGLYDILFKNRDKLLIFDDMDSVWNDKASVNLLKAALDTYPEREISRMIKTNFDSSDMDDKEIQAEHEKTGKLPKQFIFRGRIIFITNMKGKDIDSAIISRSLHVDVDLNREEVLKRMRTIMSKLFTKLPEEMKEETLEFLDFITSKFDSKFPLNIRTLIHSLNIRMANDGLTIDVGGEKVPAWQMLIKNYLVKK